MPRSKSRLETSITHPTLLYTLPIHYIYIQMKAQAVARVAGAGVLLAAGANAEVAFKVCPLLPRLC